MRYLILVPASMAIMIASVRAQTTTNFDPPELKIVDNVGINMVSGLAQFRSSPVSIGPKDSGLTFNLRFNGHATWANNADDFGGDIYQTYDATNVDITVRLFGKSDVFRNGATTDLRQTGSTLIPKADGSYEYVDRDGVRYFANPAIKGWGVVNNYYYSVLDDVTRLSDPLTFSWRLAVGFNMAITKVVYPDGREIDISRSPLSGTSIKSVTTNSGYQLRYGYDTSGHLDKVTAVNLAVDYCEAASSNCAYSREWPSATFIREDAVVNLEGPTTLTTIDSAGGVTKYFTQTGFGQHQSGARYWYSRLHSVKSPSSPSAATITIGYASMFYCTADVVECTEVRGSVVRTVDIGTGHWNYSYRQPAAEAPPYTGLRALWETTATSQEGFETKAQYDVAKGTTNYVRTSGGSGSYGEYPANRLLTASDAEGRTFAFTYDARGNVLTKTQTGTGGLAPLVLEANYDIVCGNPVTCNKPNWVKDAMGNRTDYTYDPVHGGMLTETSPPDANGVRPQKRNKYVQRTALIKNSSGGYSPAGPPIWVLDTSSYCRTSNATTAGCQAANDEVVTSYDYGPNSGPNNLMLRGQVVTADGVSRRVCSRYDVLGNVISETTANAGLASCN